MLIVTNLRMGCDHGNTFHPIHRLDVGTLGEIFLLVVEEQKLYSATMIERPKNALAETPLLFGAICKAWRAVAWAFPRLWTTLSFPIRSTSNTVIFYAIVREWLQRTGVLPLVIGITCFSGPTYSLYPLLDLLKQYSNRWRRLDVQFLANSFLLTHLLNNGVSTSCLDVLNINTVECEEVSPPRLELDHVNTAWTHSPKILTCDIELPRSMIRWHFLQEVDFQHVLHLNHFLRFLQDAPKVTICRVGMLRLSEFPDEDTPLDRHSRSPFFLHHLHLEHLEIEFESDPLEDTAGEVSTINELISYLKLPSLKSLTIALGSIPFDAAYADILISLITNSACSLQVFKQAALFRSGDDEDQLLRLLLRMPTLEWLGIRSRDRRFGISDHFFRQLLSLEGDPNLLPTLKVLEYTGPRKLSWFNPVAIWTQKIVYGPGQGGHFAERSVVEIITEGYQVRRAREDAGDTDERIYQEIEVIIQWSPFD